MRDVEYGLTISSFQMGLYELVRHVKGCYAYRHNIRMPGAYRSDLSYSRVSGVGVKKEGSTRGFRHRTECLTSAFLFSWPYYLMSRLLRSPGRSPFRGYCFDINEHFVILNAASGGLRLRAVDDPGSAGSRNMLG
jgi:hypothetical protein